MAHGGQLPAMLLAQPDQVTPGGMPVPAAGGETDWHGYGTFKRVGGRELNPNS